MKNILSRMKTVAFTVTEKEIEVDVISSLENGLHHLAEQRMKPKRHLIQNLGNCESYKYVPMLQIGLSFTVP